MCYLFLSFFRKTPSIPFLRTGFAYGDILAGSSGEGGGKCLQACTTRANLGQNSAINCLRESFDAEGIFAAWDSPVQRSFKMIVRNRIIYGYSDSFIYNLKD
jgi:hypothetical protein